MVNTPDQAGKRPRGRAPQIALAILAGLAVTAGALYFIGAYDSWTDDAAPEHLCDGLVQRDDRDLQRLLGVRGPSAADVITDRTSDEPRECDFSPRENGTGTRYEDLDITVSRNAGVSDGVAQRLVLRDTDGERLVLDPRVLVANPLLLHHLDQGVHRSLEAFHGALRSSGLE
ncbi:hypothetical protein [Streptomyces regalis]|uniref:Uncharacterized protein n=1 Tax=Streptomyces regalis TaxID=68262 RepID=A0A0X3VCZ0_9ACTN|nr:hypothetical protein [Streptomyces regalis]KUL42673.1 hypothetical protein ADL12_09620 [Streptomyces regalis]